ncbi:MAG: ABC transporter permease subunit [Eggerthellaceae bacterium]|jgi:NitT/TauT family transport system permease protein
MQSIKGKNLPEKHGTTSGAPASEIPASGHADAATRSADGIALASEAPVPPTRKTVQRRLTTVRELVRMILPIAIILIAYGMTTGMPNIYPTGYVEEYYPLFLVVSFVTYGASVVIACFVAPLRRIIVRYAPLIAAMFATIEVVDVLSLKTGLLLLPFAPSPDRVLQALPKNSMQYLQNLGASLLLLGEGALAGLVSGFLTGLFMGWSKIANYWFAPLLKFIGPVPSAAWLPIAVALMPSAHAAGVLLIAVAIWFPLSLVLSSGIRSTDKRKIEAARVMGASEGYILFHVALPSAVPDIFTALFMGLSSSFGALIVSEQLGVKAGLGWYINWASSWGEYYKVYATVGIFILLFYVIISLLFKIRDHVMKWQKSVVRW